MPNPKQMEKLAAEAARRRGPAAAAGPDAPLPDGYWESVLKDPRAMRRRGPDTTTTSFGNSAPRPARLPAAAPLRERDRGNPDPPMQSDCIAATRSGRRTLRSGCSTTLASSAPAVMRKTGAGLGFRRRSLLWICRSDLFARGCPDCHEVSPYAAVGWRPQGSDERARQSTRNGQHPGHTSMLVSYIRLHAAFEQLQRCYWTNFAHRMTVVPNIQTFTNEYARTKKVGSESEALYTKRGK